MVRPELDAYTYRFVGEEKVGERTTASWSKPSPRTRATSSTARPSRRSTPPICWSCGCSSSIVQGKLFKVWTLEKVEKIDGIWTPLVQRWQTSQDKHESQLDAASR